MTSETSRQVEGVVSAIATQSAISGDAALEAALEPCVLPDGRTAIVLGKALEDAVRNAAIRHREQPAGTDIMSATLEQATAHLDSVWLTIWRMSEAPHLNGGKTKRIGTDLAHATRVLYGLRETLRKARREWDALDEAERLVGPDSGDDEDAGEPGAPEQRWDNVWTEDAWLAAHPGKMPPDVDRLKVTCAARLYERASTDVDARESTHAACKRAIEACENHSAGASAIATAPSSSRASSGSANRTKDARESRCQPSFEKLRECTRGKRRTPRWRSRSSIADSAHGGRARATRAKARARSMCWHASTRNSHSLRARAPSSARGSRSTPAHTRWCWHRKDRAQDVDYAPGMTDAARRSPTRARGPRRTHEQRLAPLRRRGIAHRLPRAFAERKRRMARTRQHDRLNGERTHNVGG